MDYDFGVIGGGPVGSLAALLLAQQGFSVALLDPRRPVEQDATLDLRVSVLTPFSWNLLDSAGITAGLDPKRFAKILAMKVFEEEDALLSFYASEIGRDRLGVLIENEVLLQAIQASFPPTIQRVFARCLSLTAHTEGYTLIPEAEQPVNVRFLLLAQGGNTALSNPLHIPFETYDYQEEALVFHVESELPHHSTAYQRFLPRPLAFLPLYHSHVSSIVWALAREEAQRMKSLSPDPLAEKLNEAFPLLGALKIISEIAHFPLYAQQAKIVSGHRFALLGDAAHIVHPLAGQGVNLGFRDVAVFSKLIAQNKARKHSLGEPSLKDAYRRETLKYNQGFSRSFSGIHTLYGLAPLAPLRQIGSRYVGRILPLKKELMKWAIGERFSPL